jgi:LPXTG-motif cell wall-anchored protein
MEADGESLNAFVPLTIVNTEGFDLPNTGDNGTLIFTAGGILMMFAAVVVILFVCKKPKDATANASKK